MKTLLLRRIVLGVLTLWLVSIVVFVATQALPGDAASAILGRNATPLRLAALRQQMNLDHPALYQYLHWVSGVVVGNFGHSLVNGLPVTQLLADRIGNSALLFLTAAAVSIPLALLIGIVSAMMRDSPLDHILSTWMLVLAALPEFVVALVLIIFLATGVLHLFPAVATLTPGIPASQQLVQIVLPTATLALSVIPYISRIMRGSMIEVLESEYVEMARMKGLPEAQVVLRHCLPNAIIPTIHVTALNLAWLAGGIVIIEYVFGYPGIGAALVEAVTNRDIPVVQALTLIAASVYVALNLAADVLTILASPRLKTSLNELSSLSG